jgi:hypothetical protein
MEFLRFRVMHAKKLLLLLLLHGSQQGINVLLIAALLRILRGLFRIPRLLAG